MATDLSKSSFDQVMDLIKTANGLTDAALTGNDVELVDLNPLVDDVSGKNTSLVVNSLPNRRYTGSVSIKYNRMNIENLDLLGGATIVVEDDFSDGDIIAAINTTYGTNLSLDDDITLSDTSLIDYDGDIVTMTAKVTSLAWIGVYDILIKIAQIQLSSILINPELNGLRWPGVALPSIAGVYSTLANAPKTLRYVSAVKIGGDVYVIALNANGANQTNVFKYNIANNTWSTVSNVASPLFNHNKGGALHHLNGFLYSPVQVGGVTSWWKYSIANNSHELLNAAYYGSNGLSNRGLCFKGTKAYHQGSAGIIVHDLVSGVTDSTIPYPATSALTAVYSTLAIFENTLYVFASETTNPQCWKMDLGTKQWTRLTNAPRKWNYEAPALYNESFYFYAGSATNGSTGDRTRTLWRYNIQEDAWISLPTGPDDIAGNGLVAIDDALIVIGGANTVPISAVRKIV